MGTLNIEFKRKRSTEWELKVRHHGKVNAHDCNSLSGFVYCFNEDLSKYPRTNTGHIAMAYKAVERDGFAEIIWTSPTSETRTIAIITEQ